MKLRNHQFSTRPRIFEGSQYEHPWYDHVDDNLNRPLADSSGSGYGYRLYLALKEGSEVMTLPNMCITEYSVTLSADAVHEETITFYGNVTPVIGTAMNFTTTASTAF